MGNNPFKGLPLSFSKGRHISKPPNTLNPALPLFSNTSSIYFICYLPFDLVHHKYFKSYSTQLCFLVHSALFWSITRMYRIQNKKNRKYRNGQYIIWKIYPQKYKVAERNLIAAMSLWDVKQTWTTETCNPYNTTPLLKQLLSVTFLYRTFVPNNVRWIPVCRNPRYTFT